LKRSIFGGALLVLGCVFGTNAISQVTPQACPQAAAEDGNVLPPLITKRVNPRYPGIAQANFVDGDVMLDVVIGTNGLVQDMTVTHGLPQLIRAATHAVSQWQYQPARINGVAIACKTTIDVHFLLQTDPAAAAALNAANNFAPHTVPPNGVAAVHPMLPPPPDGVLRVSPRVIEAQLENDVKPVYPADAVALDARGTVFC
jgi:TonB family protein